MTPERVPLNATWWPNDITETHPEVKSAELEVAFDGSTVSIYGLRQGRHVSVDLIELLAAVVISERGLAPPPTERAGLDAAA